MSMGRKSSVLSKRSHKEIVSEVGIEVGSKRSRNAEITELSVEARSQPRGVNKSLNLELAGAWEPPCS